MVQIHPHSALMFFAYKNGIQVKSIEDDTVVFEVEGCSSVQEGEYMSDSNTTIEIEVSRDRAEEMAREILEE